MNDNARGDLEPPQSGEPTREQTDDDGCPTCGEEIAAVERRGPGDVLLQPCGHDVGDTLAQNFPRARGRAMTDGGQPVEHAESSESELPTRYFLAYVAIGAVGFTLLAAVLHELNPPVSITLGAGVLYSIPADWLAEYLQELEDEAR